MLCLCLKNLFDKRHKKLLFCWHIASTKKHLCFDLDIGIFDKDEAWLNAMTSPAIWPIIDFRWLVYYKRVPGYSSVTHGWVTGYILG